LCDLSGSHILGYRYEDILIEVPDCAEALARLPPEVLSDRDDRLKEGLVLSAAGKILPKERWTTAAQDKAYLAPYLAQVIQERRDREAFRPR
jgi:ubiquinol-cytochrome c reductase subunit 7